MYPVACNWDESSQHPKFSPFEQLLSSSLMQRPYQANAMSSSNTNKSSLCPAAHILDASTEDGSQPRSAVTQVLGITELLELIILHMRCRDILVNQRVCRVWKSTIATSEAIHKACGFRVMKKAMRFPHNRGMRLLGAISLSWIPWSAHAFLKSVMEDRHDRLYLHPLLGTIFKVRHHNADGRFHFNGRLVYRGLHTGEGNAVYDRIYLTQPPCTKMDFWLQYVIDRSIDKSGDFCNIVYPTSICNPSGLTIGDLVRKINTTHGCRSSHIYVRNVYCTISSQAT